MGLLSPKSFLGIDIGSAGIKIVELKKEGGRAKLITYGFSENDQVENKEGWHGHIEKTAILIRRIIKESGAKSHNAATALPTFSVFSSVINLASADRKDLAAAVHWQAKKVIPLPLEEMVLDWKLIKEEKDKANAKVLLTGAPKNLVKKYVDIFREAKINLLSLETETFSLIRSLLGNDKSTVMIIDIGHNITDISVVSKSIPMFSRSVDTGGLNITRSISNALNIGLERAEQFKYDMGISSLASGNDVVPETIKESLTPVINEVKYVLDLFQTRNQAKCEKIILSGGSSLLINFANYLSKILDIQVVVGDPWSRISYPVSLKDKLEEIGPRMSVAIGLAMREIE